MRVAKSTLCGVGVLSVGFVVAIAAQGPRPQDSDVLPALLTEVRGLRAAMEQMASAGPRVQLALGRLQLQEQRINTMLRRLDSVRDSINSIEKEKAGVESQFKMMEATVKEQLRDMPAGSTEKQHPMGQMLDALQKSVARGTDDVLRLQAEEAQLQQQVVTEQGRWTEINSALEDLERALGKRGGV
jgi:chromosome segregation ATPase